MKKNGKIFTVLIIAVIVVFFGVIIYKNKTAPGDYDQLAQCLSDKNAKFYGAYWCPHCDDQKEAFGRSFKYVNYIECALPNNPRVQTEECKQAGITGYPTWIFNDGTRKPGKLSFDTLSELSGCEL